MVVGNVVKWLGLALVGAFLFMSVADPSRASATVSTLRSGGTLLSTYGGGIRDLFEGIGTGTAKLLNPFWTLRDLIYGPQAGAQVDTAVREAVSTGQAITASGIIANVEENPSPPFNPGNTPGPGPLFGGQQPLSVPFFTDTSISPVPVANVSVHGQNVPLSQAAISYYQNLGVTVSPQNAETVASQNSSNANSSNSASTSTNVSSSGVSFASSGHSGSWSGGGFGAAN
jgi:hypothetical protein